MIENYPVNKLIFPEYPFRIKQGPDTAEIFDEFRRKWVNLTPEEWVRQHVAVYLRDNMGYPGGRIGLEISLRVNQLQKRADIIVAHNNGSPWMVVECKSTEVKIDNSVFFQAATYNSQFRAPFLLVTNGLSMFCAAIDVEKNEWAMLQALPTYP